MDENTENCAKPSGHSASPAIVIPDNFAGHPLESFVIAPSLVPYLQYVMVPGGFIRDRIERLACDIVLGLPNEPLTALCVLKGGYLFFNELVESMRRLYRYQMMDARHAQSVDSTQQIKLEFIRLKSYEDDHSKGEVKVIGIESLQSLRGRNVLVVEDIIDTGKSMVKLLELLKPCQPKSVRVASLFVKRSPLSNGYLPEYVGFNIPDHFIVGFNIDYNERYRDLNHLCIVSDYGKSKFSNCSNERLD